MDAVALTVAAVGPDTCGVRRRYDLAMTHLLDTDSLFLHAVQEQAGRCRLDYFLVDPFWVEEARARIESGRLEIRVLLNLHSEHHRPEDPFTRFVHRAVASGTRVIDPPDRASEAFHKGRMHARLVQAGFAVPETRLARRAEGGAWVLEGGGVDGLGRPFVIKPAQGYGRRGVLLDATGLEDLDRSAAAWPDEVYLLQERIVPEDLGGRPGYFRGYHVFGRVWLAWWNCYTDAYQEVTAEDEARFELAGLRGLIGDLAALIGLDFFSTEVARVEGRGWVWIDYVNDQCHMLSQGADPRIGVPDAMVRGIAAALVEGASRLCRA